MVSVALCGAPLSQVLRLYGAWPPEAAVVAGRVWRFGGGDVATKRSVLRDYDGGAMWICTRFRNFTATPFNIAG
jgi:hypothetical protein